MKNLDSFYHRRNNITKQHVVLNHSQLNYTFTSLNPNTIYGIEIKAIDAWQRSSQIIKITGKTLRKNEKFSSHKLVDPHLLEQYVSCYHLNDSLLLIEVNRSKSLIQNAIYNLTIYNNDDQFVLTDNLYSPDQRLPFAKTLNSFIYALRDNDSRHKIKLTLSTRKLEYVGLINKHCEDFYPIYSPITCSIKHINDYEHQLMINMHLFNNHKQIMTLKPTYMFYQINEIDFIKRNIHNIHKVSS